MPSGVDSGSLEGLRQCVDSLDETLDWGLHKPGTDHPRAGHFAGHTCVDLWKNFGANYPGGIDADRCATELEHRNLVHRVLGHRDLVHRQRSAHRAGCRAAMASPPRPTVSVMVESPMSGLASSSVNEPR